MPSPTSANQFRPSKGPAAQAFTTLSPQSSSVGSGESAPSDSGHGRPFNGLGVSGQTPGRNRCNVQISNGSPFWKLLRRGHLKKKKPSRQAQAASAIICPYKSPSVPKRTNSRCIVGTSLHHSFCPTRPTLVKGALPDAELTPRAVAGTGYHAPAAWPLRSHWTGGAVPAAVSSQASPRRPAVLAPRSAP